MRRFFSILFASIVAFGCSTGQFAGTPGRRPTERASGIVRFEGKPLQDAHVTFHPRGEGQAAFGRTDQKGRFRLQTYEEGDGALVGSYLVTVTKLEAESNLDKTPEEWFAEMEKRTKGEDATKSQAFRSLIPQQYADPKTSGLSAEVSSGSKNNFTFEL